MNVEAGTFEVVRARLDEQARTLSAATQQLNAQRQALFGGDSTRLLTSARVRTEHHAVPRDIVAIGDRLLLGYQVFLGLKSHLTPADVFTELRDDGTTVLNLDPEHPPRLLDDAGFAKDFAEVVQYHKDAKLLHLRRMERLLLAAFQTGSRISDVRVLRWALTGTGGDETLRYLDNRGERDYVFPPAHDFTWTRATRDMHVQGAHPHIAINDEVFVECIHGDLTIKIENNTKTGAGIFSDPVDDPTQGLDDAEIFFAVLPACILFKIRPYREQAWRYVVFNRVTREAVRIDAIGHACQQLPESHGLIFPGGYYLSTGAYKVFPLDASGMEFKRLLRAPNGEDVAYVFYRRDTGSYLLLQYNLIAREVATPTVCASYCRLRDGRMVVLRSEPEATRVHTLQIWQTPFVDDEIAAAKAPSARTGLVALGNRELVRAVSDCLHLTRLVAAQRPSRQVYEDLLKSIAAVIDTYPWLGEAEAFGIRAVLDSMRGTAEQMIDEFEKVLVLMAQAEAQLTAAEQQADAISKAAALADHSTIDGFIAPLSEVRAARGHAETLKTVRHMDLARLAALDQRLAKHGQELASGAVGLLLKPAALDAWQQQIAASEHSATQVASVRDAAAIGARLDATASGIDHLVSVVNSLDFSDAAARTTVLERIGDIYAQLNRARAVLTARTHALGSAEAAVDFAVQDRLLTQGLANAIALSDTPEACTEFTAKLLLQVEELEGRFADYDTYITSLAERRIAVSEQLAARRQALIDERSRKSDAWQRAAERILQSAASRVVTFTAVDQVHAWFGSDPLIAKVRTIIDDLRRIGDQVKADDLAGRLKAVREDGVRSCRDKSDLFDGPDVVRIGRHRFSVTTAALDVVMLPRATSDGVRMHLHLTGTDYSKVVDDPRFAATAAFWELPVESETPSVYRGEYLAWQILRAAQTRRDGASLELLRNAALSDATLLAMVQEAAAQRVDQGYERGVHDHDAMHILRALLHLDDTCGVLRFSPAARSVALLAWARCPDRELTRRLHRHARSLAMVRARFGSDVLRSVVDACATLIAEHYRDAPCREQAALYLGEELARNEVLRFARSADAIELSSRFAAHQRQHADSDSMERDLSALRDDVQAQADVATAWVESFARSAHPELVYVVPEVVAEWLAREVPRDDLSVRTSVAVTGLLGTHPRITDGTLLLRIDEASERLSAMDTVHVPAWRAYAQVRRDVLASERERLRLQEFTPRVLTTFVRNRLINEVFLPWVGDNFAKQIGALGDTRRTDLQGLLLLISPPGYGKTTLMEYVCAVLGLAFVKVNGPALGNRVTSLDPAEAPNAQARQEVERINLAFAMGNNVMLYLDDIQHCNAELLQKFISLCDGQRRIETVMHGQTRTVDLRGKKFAVVMAGNPYTETGEIFRIPDMLANRADIHNLGDAAGAHAASFALSYLENCLAVNPILQPLLARPLADVERLQRIAAGDDGARSELEFPYSSADISELSAVFRLLARVQRIALLVNQAYIASAAQAEGFRTEPAFKLQGSYRTMAKIAARVVPAMTEAEVDALVLAHYRAESQTLSTLAEANVLKLRHLVGWATPDDQQRWSAICRTYSRRQDIGDGDDPMAQAVTQLARLGERVEALQQALISESARGASAESERLERVLSQVAATLREAAPRIEVVNTLPKYYAQMFDHHLKVIEVSLAPALDLLGRYVGTTQQTRDKMERIADDLRQLAQRQQAMGYRETPPSSQ